MGGLALENCETLHSTLSIQRGEGCACDSVDLCPFLQIIKISLYLHTNSIAKPPKKIIYREKNNCKKHFSSNSQVAELPLVESRWLGRWIDPPANETSLERDSDSGTKNSARMSCYFKRRSNDVLASKYSSCWIRLCMVHALQSPLFRVSHELDYKFTTVLLGALFADSIKYLFQL